jgi:hypothetical protein
MTQSAHDRSRPIASRARRGEAFTEGGTAPFAVMQATMTALYDRPGLRG